MFVKCCRIRTNYLQQMFLLIYDFPICWLECNNFYCPNIHTDRCKMIELLAFNPVSKKQVCSGDKEAPPLTVYYWAKKMEGHPEEMEMWRCVRELCEWFHLLKHRVDVCEWRGRKLEVCRGVYEGSHGMIIITTSWGLAWCWA